MKDIDPAKTNNTPIPPEIHAIRFNAFIRLSLDSNPNNTIIKYQQ